MTQPQNDSEDDCFQFLSLSIIYDTATNFCPPPPPPGLLHFIANSSLMTIVIILLTQWLGNFWSQKILFRVVTSHFTSLSVPELFPWSFVVPCPQTGRPLVIRTGTGARCPDCWLRSRRRIAGLGRRRSSFSSRRSDLESEARKIHYFVSSRKNTPIAWQWSVEL